MKKCSFCGEQIQDEAVKCRHCKHDLTAPPADHLPVDAAVAAKTSRRRIRLVAWILTAALGLAVLVVVGLMWWGHACTADLWPVRQGGKYGYINGNARVVIPFQFDDAKTFAKKGLAEAMVGGRWGLINESGEWVLPAKYEEVRDCGEGMRAVRREDQWGLVDNSGALVTAVEYDDACKFARFEEGLVKIALKSDRFRFGYVDTAGRRVTGFQFTFSSGRLSNGMANVQLENGGPHGFIDKTGRVVVTPQYSATGDFHEERARVRLQGSGRDQYGFIDKAGKLVIPAIYDDVNYFSSGVAAVGTGGHWEYPVIGDDDETHWSTRPDPLLPDSMAKVGRRLVGTKWGLVDRNGAIVLAPQFDAIGRFGEGLAAFRVGDKVGFLDPSGAVKIKPAFSAESLDEDLSANWFEPIFEDGAATVLVNGKRAIIDKTGAFLFPAVFSCVQFERADFIAVADYDAEGDCGKWGFADLSGKVVLPMQFDDVAAPDDPGGLWEVVLGKKVGYLDRKLEYVWEPS